MNKYLKKTLVTSASVLMLLSAGMTVNNVNARRYHSRYARHYTKRSRHRSHRRAYRGSKRKPVSKRFTKRINHKRWRNIRRYRTGYFDHYGAWHKYNSKAKRSRHNVKKYHKARKAKVYRPVSHKKHRQHHETYVEKTDAARNENFNDVNADRESVGVDDIQRSSLLDQIAQERSKQLVTNDSHYDSSGNLAAQDDLSDDGYDPDVWNGENIMSNSGYELNGKRSGDQANKQWWTGEKGATPDLDGGHRKNIRNADFQSIGIGATYVPSTDSWYMCQDFSDETPDQLDNGNGDNSNTASGESEDQSQNQDNNDGSASATSTASGGSSSSSGNGESSINDDGISVTSGSNGTFINGKEVSPNGTYNEPNGAKVTFGNGNVTVRGADGSESSSSL